MTTNFIQNTNIIPDATSLGNSLQPPPTPLTKITSEIYVRVIKNPFFWAVAIGTAAATAITFTAVLLPATLATALSLSIVAAFGMGLYAQSTDTKKWMFSEASLFNSTLVGLLPSCIIDHPWYNEITPHITLGAAPLKDRAHFHNICGTHQSVLSMIEDFEHAPHLMGIPAKAEDWRQTGVVFLNLPNPDCTPVKLEDVKAGVEWMHQEISQNKKVYVHCLAGVGRSATVVVCYLIKYGHYTPEQAVALVKSKRTIVIKESSRAVVAFVQDLNRTN